MLSCRLFRWPNDLDSVVKVSAARLENCRVQSEKSLKERTSKFLERLTEYAASMEHFINKETSNVSMEEMRTSAAFLETLHRNLQIAKMESNDINRDENLLGWSLTLTQELSSLIEFIEPYYQLWHVAYNFHCSYDKWFHGE